MKKTEPTIALVYDKVNTTYGGAEWVLLALHQAFPNAPLYTTLYDQRSATWAKPFRVLTSFLQKLPTKNHKLLVWLFPLAFESLDLSSYDVIISITSGEAKGVITKPSQIHISYILTPPRYLYTHKEKYLQGTRVLSLPGISFFTKLAIRYLTWWDRVAVYRPDTLIAISKRIQKRITTVYKRNSDLIYPPLPIPNDVKDISPIASRAPFLLSLSRLVQYKRIDLSLKAALNTKKTLVIAGEGEEKQNLIKLAGSQAQIRTTEKLADFIRTHTSSEGLVLFVGHVSNTERLQLLASASALLMPGLEDFGITALEAAYLGTPSIIHKESGVAEVLSHKKATLHIPAETTSAVTAALKQLSNTTFDLATLQDQAKACSTKVFTSKFREYVYDSIIQLEKN